MALALLINGKEYTADVAPEETLLAFRQEGVAPLDRGTKRLMPRRAVALSGGEHAQSVIEPLE